MIPLGNAIGALLDRIFRRQRAAGLETGRPVRKGNGTESLGLESGSQQYLQSIKDKLAVLADDFAHGRVNRAQYEELYSHYQRQKRMIENLQTAFGDSEDAKRAITEGRSLIIRRRNQAQVIAFSIYSNDGHTLLYAYGRFPMDNAQVVTMLSGFCEALRGMRGTDLQKTEVEDGRVLCFIGGERTTLLILYSIDPSPRQLDTVRKVHEDFETNNRDLLTLPEFDPEDLFVPVGRIIGVGPTLSQLAAMTG